MIKVKIVFYVLCLCVSVSYGQAESETEKLTRLLHEFLDGASRNDIAMHDRFWADDLIYTGSTGRRVGKADILNDLRSMPDEQSDNVLTQYTAEDIRIQLYGSAAVVAFRLVAETITEEETEILNFFNTGTFVKRDGVWQAVAWQATRIP